jgi:hypothetical protein
MHTEGHDMGRDAADSSTPGSQTDANNPGYELTDVNASGVAVFLAGLFGFVIIFFFVCYGLGILINGYFVKEDGAATKWKVEAGAAPPGKGNNLESNSAMQQKQLQQMTANFPSPRLDIDDGNQATADLHAREDLLLEHYSSVDGQAGTIRIPIDRAMELIAQRGLTVAGQSKAGQPVLVTHAGTGEGNASGATMFGDAKPPIQAPLTTGFARTGYELTVMEAREQKMNYGRAVASESAPAPGK